MVNPVGFKVIGIWFYMRDYGREIYGQVYYGENAHRTSAEYKDYQDRTPRWIAEMCIAKNWPYQYLFE